MIFIENESLNPYFNLACEEYCLRELNLNDTIVMLWRDDNTIVVGKHQNAIEEINNEFVREHDIKVSRRITGGGAVYHDTGNLNYSFILDVDRVDVTNMKFFAEPVVKALEKMGIVSEFSGRNDITIDGKKISGTAQAIIKNRMLYHGTLLFDSNMEVLSKALKVKLDKVESKGIKSVKSRVTNIKDYLKEDYTVLDFKRILLSYLFDGQEFKEYMLTEKDMAAIKKLQTEKFSTWDFIYGKAPEFNISNSRRFTGGSAEVFLDVKEGIINNIKIFGDFLGVKRVDDIENILTGKKYSYEDMKCALDGTDLAPYFGIITKDELLSCLWS